MEVTGHDGRCHDDDDGDGDGDGMWKERGAEGGHVMRV